MSITCKYSRVQLSNEIIRTRSILPPSLPTLNSVPVSMQNLSAATEQALNLRMAGHWMVGLRQRCPSLLNITVQGQHMHNGHEKIDACHCSHLNSWTVGVLLFTRAYISEVVSLELHPIQQLNLFCLEECLPTQPLKFSEGTERLNRREGGLGYSSDRKHNQDDIVLPERSRICTLSCRFGGERWSVVSGEVNKRDGVFCLRG